MNLPMKQGDGGRCTSRQNPRPRRWAALCGEDADSVARYRDQVFSWNRSLIDLLEDFPSCKLPLNNLCIFVEHVPILKPRYYSISSSPLVSPSQLSITVAVVEGPARSGHGDYRGVASGYLAGLAEGGEAECFVRPPSIPFFPPADPATPMITVRARGVHDKEGAIRRTR